MKHFLLAALLIGATAQASDKNLSSDMDALGGNQDLMDRANAVDPSNSTRIVQKREVDRDLRIELGLNYGIVAGGDSYVNTNNLGADLEFHINPHWSIGGRWYQSANSLNSEGSHQMDLANQLQPSNPNYPRPDIDYAKQTWLGTIEYYPFYGKINFADLTVKQFDIYFLGGGGQVFLQNGTVPTYTGGMGFAFWLTQHFSTRLEARYQGYTDHFTDGTTRQMDLTVLTLGIGFLL